MLARDGRRIVIFCGVSWLSAGSEASVVVSREAEFSGVATIDDSSVDALDAIKAISASRVLILSKIVIISSGMRGGYARLGRVRGGMGWSLKEAGAAERRRGIGPVSPCSHSEAGRSGTKGAGPEAYEPPFIWT
jgi:hypothetical protein